jgi:putative YphP/YqiW family bacilliredoxin
VRPARVVTVFAGQDREATERARGYFTGHAPSSPSMALLKDGAVVAMLPRHAIEGRASHDIAADLVRAFDAHCTPAAG